MNTSSTEAENFANDMITVSQQLMYELPRLFAHIEDKIWDQVLLESSTLFYPWQFERLLNGAADLLDRASEDRTRLIQLMAEDFVLRLDLEASEQRIQHDKARVNLPGQALDAPVAFAAINLVRLKQIHSQKKEIIDAFSAQVDNLKQFETNDSSDAGKRLNWRAVADTSAATAQQKQFSISVNNSEREATAEAEEVDRNRKEVTLAMKQHGARVTAAANGGQLDAGFEAIVVARRMWRDYFEAMPRLVAATKGLQDILGLKQPQLKPSGSIRVIDAIVNAQERARQLILWHSRQTQFDQGFTVVISLREFCTESEWMNFLRGGARLNFPVDESSFGSWWLPRIRGISATYTGTDSRPIRLHVTAPAFAVRSDGSRIAQPAPECVLGRVLSAASPREPEFCGAVTLMNLCPIQAKGSSWGVELRRFGPKAKADGYSVDDVVLELTCMGIPSQKAGSWASQPLDAFPGPKPEPVK